MPLAFLFDLDMTLVDSSQAEAFRSVGKWKEVSAMIPNFKPFPSGDGPSAHEVPMALHQQGHKIAIVTTSPKGYAEQVIEHFGIYYDVLIAHQDTLDHKPHPAPILHALKSLGMPPNKSIYVGDSIDDFQAASAAKVYCMGAYWGMGSILKARGDMPDAFLVSPSDILGDCQNWALLCEFVFSQAGLPVKGGVIVKCDPVEPIYTLGRYFQTGDRRHSVHRLSSELIKLKTRDVSTDKFAHSLHRFLKTLSKIPDFLVSVPVKPDQRNRFSPILEMVRQFRRAEKLPPITLVPDAMFCEKTVKGYKGLDAQDRSDRIAGTIGTDYTWAGKTLVVVDDVYTTGSTMRECIRALKADGANNVIGVSFGKDQTNRNPTFCPVCNSVMKIRTNKKTKVQFLGCSRYPDCTATLSI